MTRHRLLRVFAFLGVIVAMVLGVLAGTAAAAEVTTNTNPTSVIPASVSLQPWIVALLAGTVTPLVTGLITKYRAAEGVKALVSFVLVAIATVLNVIVTSNGMFQVRDTVVLFFTTLIAHAATYYQIWEPMGQKGLAPTNLLLKTVGFGQGVAPG